MHVECHSLIEMRETLVDEFPVCGEHIFKRFQIAGLDFRATEIGAQVFFGESETD